MVLRVYLFFIFLLFPVYALNAYQYTSYSPSQSDTSIGGGGIIRVPDYIKEEGYNDVISYRFDIDDFPIYICISNNMSGTKACLISRAADIWEEEYGIYLKKFQNIAQAMRKEILPPYNLFKLICSNYDVYIREEDLYQPGRTVYGRTDYRTFFFKLWLWDMKILFNKSFGFNFFPEVDNNGSPMYFLNTALHELGHVLGLGHTKIPNLMYPDAYIMKEKLFLPDESNIKVFLKLYAEVGRYKGIEYIKVTR